MSGISGAWRFAGDITREYSYQQIQKFAQVLAHRGNALPPPAVLQNNEVLLISNYFTVSVQDGTKGMYADEREGLFCAVAGRIYNVRSLKKQLEANGKLFTVNTQDEAVINAYRMWGPAFPLHLNGQFAGVIWDSQKQKLFMFRDRLGQRDLFYSITPEGVYFGSELKAILPYLKKKPELNPSAIANVLSNQFIYEPLTAYQNIFKMEKAAIRWVDINGRSEAQCYWNIFEEYENGLENPILSFEQAKKQLRQATFDAVESQLLPGEEIGSFLSGGLDSTIVSGILSKIAPRKIHTFSIGFKRQIWDESSKFHLASEYLKTDHHDVMMSYKDIENDWERILFHYDEPYADAAAYGEYLCGKLASRYVNCAFGGEGGDELFMGFELQQRLHYSHCNFRIAACKWRDSKLAVQRFYPETYQLCSNKDLRKLMKAHNFLNNAQAMNSRCLYQTSGSIAQRIGLGYLNVYHLVELIKIDRACQLAGIETRRPLQDECLVNLSFRLNVNHCICGQTRRYLYREAFRDFLPDEIYYQKKMGFGLPVVEWLYEYRQDEVRRLFHRDLIEAQGIFNYSALNPYLERFFNGKADYSFWYFYAVQKWYVDYYLRL